MNLRDELSRIKDLCREFYGVEDLYYRKKHEYIRMYPGFNIELEMSEFIKKYKVNVWIYVPTDDKFTEFKRTDTYIYNEDCRTMKLLLLYLPLEDKTELIVPHFTLIKNLDNLTGRRWCPKYGNFFDELFRQALLGKKYYLQTCVL